MKLIHRDSTGREVASAWFEPLVGQSYRLDWIRQGTGMVFGLASDRIELTRQALQEASRLGADAVVTRITEAGDWEALHSALLGLGFKVKSHRIEYRANLAELPDDVATPLAWEFLAPVGSISESFAARMMKESSLGDPGSDPAEDPVAALRGELAESELSSGSECVQVGFLEGKPAAFIIAQVNPKTGWSRISYMGLLPEFRGMGLGRWVHRHGFAMMRSQHGTLYHGGTLAENLPMIKLFTHHRCTEYRRMQELIIRFGEAT